MEPQPKMAHSTEPFFVGGRPRDRSHIPPRHSPPTAHEAPAQVPGENSENEFVVHKRPYEPFTTREPALPGTQQTSSAPGHRPPPPPRMGSSPLGQVCAHVPDQSAHDSVPPASFAGEVSEPVSTPASVPEAGSLLLLLQADMASSALVTIIHFIRSLT